MHTRNNGSRQVDDWASVEGATAEIVKEGRTLACGIIDGVTTDGAIVRLQEDTGRRRLYERCGSIEVWAARDHLGLNYRVSAAETVQSSYRPPHPVRAVVT
jgi:hypothetical protein